MPVVGLNWLEQPDEPRVFLQINRSVIGKISTREALRRMPQAMPAVDTPVFAAGLPDLIEILFEFIVVTDKAEENDTRPDVGRQHQLYRAVRQAISIRPTLVVDLGYVHGEAASGKSRVLDDQYFPYNGPKLAQARKSAPCGSMAPKAAQTPGLKICSSARLCMQTGMRSMEANAIKSAPMWS